jgi:hypothetical protein
LIIAKDLKGLHKVVKVSMCLHYNRDCVNVSMNYDWNNMCKCDEKLMCITTCTYGW